jgi:uncharacterized protein (DUF2345 family)
MLTNADKVAASFSTAAVTHRTVGLAAHLGIRQANASTLDDESAPLQAALKTASGMVGIDSLAVARSDAAVRNTSVGKDKAPHTTDPIIAIVAQAGFDAVAGQSVQLVNGESVVLMCVQDMQFAEGGQMRVHTGQVFGVLGGAVEAGTGSVGLQVLAAKDLINVQAQADLLNVQAHNEINVTSASAYVDWATAKSIRLSTSGGANITIEGGKIKVQGPGEIAIHAGKKSFTGPASSNYPLPTWPSSEPVCIECLIKALRSGSPLAMVSA